VKVFFCVLYGEIALSGPPLPRCGQTLPSQESLAFLASSIFYKLFPPPPCGELPLKSFFYGSSPSFPAQLHSISQIKTPCVTRFVFRVHSLPFFSLPYPLPPPSLSSSSVVVLCMLFLLLSWVFFRIDEAFKFCCRPPFFLQSVFFLLNDELLIFPLVSSHGELQSVPLF